MSGRRYWLNTSCLLVCTRQKLNKVSAANEIARKKSAAFAISMARRPRCTAAKKLVSCTTCALTRLPCKACSIKSSFVWSARLSVSCEICSAQHGLGAALLAALPIAAAHTSGGSASQQRLPSTPLLPQSSGGSGVNARMCKDVANFQGPVAASMVGRCSYQWQHSRRWSS